MYCSKCGKEINESASFCSYCGNDINNINVKKNNLKNFNIADVKKVNRNEKAYILVTAIAWILSFLPIMFTRSGKNPFKGARSVVSVLSLSISDVGSLILTIVFIAFTAFAIYSLIKNRNVKMILYSSIANIIYTFIAISCGSGLKTSVNTMAGDTHKYTYSPGFVFLVLALFVFSFICALKNKKSESKINDSNERKDITITESMTDDSDNTNLLKTLKLKSKEKMHKTLSQFNYSTDEQKSETENSQKREETSNNADIPDQLIKYKQLMDQGVITEEEFLEKKAQLLNGM